MSKTARIVSAGAMALILVASAMAVKIIFFPSVSDTYFQINPTRLRQVPSGLAVIRPTHFPVSAKRSSPPGMMQIRVKDAMWMVGRNISFQQLMATAYQHSPARIALPPDAPKGNFDLLVTVAGDPRPRLQTFIRKQLGYVAQKETRDTDVLALKVADTSLTSLTISGAGEKENVDSKGAKLFFTHMPLAEVAQGLEQFVKMPVVDKTDLTNFYNFSVDWDFKTQRDLRNDTTARATADRIIEHLGLELQPDTASLEMLVVKKL